MLKKNLLYLLAVSVLYCCAAEKDLVAYYPMDGNFNDASGNGHNLKSSVEKPNFTEDSQIKKEKNMVYGPLRAGETGGAAGNIPNVDLKKGLTLMGFYYHANNDSSGHFMGFGTEKWNAPGYLISSSYGLPCIKTGRHDIIRFPRLPPDSWSHLALVIPPETDSVKEFRFYVSGKRLEIPKGKKATVTYLTCPADFRLGEASGKRIEGKCFDEIKVYNRALTDDEIKAAAEMKGQVQTRTQGKAAPSAQKNKIGIPRFNPPEKAPEVKGMCEIRIMDSTNIAFLGYYQNFLQERFKVDCWPYLKLLDTAEYRVQPWSRAFHYNFAATDLIIHYRKIIGEAYSDAAGFKIIVNGKEQKCKRTGYWINPISASRFPDAATEKELIINSGEILHCKYLELEQPLKNGDRCEVINRLNEKISFTYSDKLFTNAIKVNQVGYAPEAGRKYAYLGIWRGPALGARDYSEWNNKDFMLIDATSGKEMFRGKIVKRIPDVFYKSKSKSGEEIKTAFSGEDVYDLDFSTFKTPGVYKIYIPEVGTSWDFKIDSDAIGEAFYVKMRGMYQKRCGIAKDSKYTNWPDDVCHKVTYQGNFPPNDRHFWPGAKTADYGFYNDQGKRLTVKPFDVIKQNCSTDKIAENVYGGWHDAADYDRRTYHFRAVEAFTSAYLMFPQNFTDGQLNLPESGNGVPDILDETVWGMDVWRRAQNADGSVGGWIESTAHPNTEVAPGKDTMPYFISFATRESTAEYAADAAALALALKKAGDTKRSALFLESAKKGYEFATNKENRKTAVLKAYVAGEKGAKGSTQTLTYKESSELPFDLAGKAAFNIYLLTGEKRYLDDFNSFYDKGLNIYIRDLHWNNTPFHFAELAVEGANRPEFSKAYGAYKKKVIAMADERLKHLDDNYSYRTPWYPQNHAYVTHMGWGVGHPLNRGGISFIVAWYLTKDTKYRDAALLCNDWQLGANPQGRSMTSGLGKVYPVRFLDIPSYLDNIAEFVPGITPYHYVFNLDYNCVRLSYGMYKDQRKDHDFTEKRFAFLPDAMNEAGRETPPQVYAENVRRKVPIFRRFGNVESWSVATSEYTVWEVIAPEAAVTGCLLTPGWKPSTDLKNRKPVSDFTKLHGLTAMP